MFLHHFLDTNILIGSRISWDRQHYDAHRYMQQDGIRRHTSERVHRECTGVFERFRRTTLKIIKKLVDDLPSNPNPFTLEKTIVRLAEQHAKSLKNEKEKQALHSFVRQNMQELRECALQTEQERNTFKQRIIDAIKGALESLDWDCRSDDPSVPIFCYTCCPDNYDTHLPIEKSTLTATIGYEPDTLVLLDAYFIQVHHIQENVCLVTTDNAHILKNREKIEMTLPGITIRGPGSFLTNNQG